MFRPAPCQRCYFIGLETKGDHLPSVCALARKLPFAASSIGLVNTEKGPVVMNGPDSRRWPLLDLQGARKPLRQLGCGRQVVVTLLSHRMTAALLRDP